MNERCEIPAYTDRWMMGDRFGRILGYGRRLPDGRDVFRVQLDKSGKTVRVVAEDCRVL